MEEADRKRVQEAVEILDREINRLQHQVLNNIDTAMIGSGHDEATLNQFIKKPLMHSVTQLRAQRMGLLKMLQNGHYPNSAQNKPS